MRSRFFDELAYYGVRALAAVVLRMDHEAGLALGRRLGRLTFYFSNRRRIAYADLKAAFGPRFTERERWDLIRRHYGHLGQMAVEVVNFRRLSPETLKQWVPIPRWDRIETAATSGRGGVLLTAHFGNWEIMQIASGARGRPVNVLARLQKHDKLNRLLNDLRESHGSTSFGRGMAVRDLMRALRRGELVGVLGDQDAGKYDGLILPFLGRKTSVPTGAFELASRTGAAVLPCFIVRRDGAQHELFIEEPILPDADPEISAQRGVERYFRLLEKFIERFPDQYLWETKRWKYSWTKRLVILSDGKPGHVKQSEAVAARFEAVKEQHGRPGMEYQVRKIEVRFKSVWHRRLFPLFAVLFIPLAQGRLRFLSFFFTHESQREIEQSSADFFISAGSGLAPLNLCLARDSRAKSIVVMKPAFPFNLFRYDLAVVPAHDRGLVPSETFRTLLAPSRFDRDGMEACARKLLPSVKTPGNVRFSFFIGGSTRGFKLETAPVRSILNSLERVSGDYLVTTSRRTPSEVCGYLKERAGRDARCQMLVIAAEDSRSEVVPGMMAMADILIVTDDSISMISEAVASGKKVMVVNLNGGISTKHRRFKEILERQNAVTVCEPEMLAEKIAALENQPLSAVVKAEQEAFEKRLQEIL